VFLTIKATGFRFPQGYVDDALMLAISKENIEQILAALIEAIFFVIPDRHFSSSMQPSYGQVGKTARCSYTNNAGTPH
jgi:hypothetical protein